MRGCPGAPCSRSWTRSSSSSPASSPTATAPSPSATAPSAARRPAAARERAAEAGAAVTFARGDMDEPLAFADAAFGAVTSRLALMIARDPVATLGEAARVTAPGGAVVTAVWARIEQNPWFGEPRAAVADALGPERASFARAFGRVGDAGELAGLHRRAGLADVQGHVL